MSVKSKYVTNQRKRSKERMVAAFGNECGKCKGKFKPEIYDFHHLNSEEKKFSLSNSKCISQKKNVEELRKCVMLCSNCHREIHNFDIDLPEDIKKFNEDFADYKEFNKSKNYCKLCGKVIKNNLKYCSIKCYNKSKQKINQDSIDLLSLKNNLKTNIAVAKYLNVSEATIRKRLKNYSRVSVIGNWKDY